MNAFRRIPVPKTSATSGWSARIAATSAGSLQAPGATRLTRAPGTARVACAPNHSAPEASRASKCARTTSPSSGVTAYFMDSKDFSSCHTPTTSNACASALTTY